MKAGILKFIINSWPPLFFAGIKVTCFEADYREAHVTLKLRWYKRCVYIKLKPRARTN